MDYSGELKEFLRKHLGQKNESQKKFDERIKGCYFSENVLDYPLIIKIIGLSDDHVFWNIISNGNLVFLETFQSNSKSKLKRILKEVDEIIKGQAEKDYCKNKILYSLLAIFFEEKSEKLFARHIKIELSPAIKKAIESDLGSFISSLDNLIKIFSNEPWRHETYQEIIINPIKEKATDLGLSAQKLSQLKKFVKLHQQMEIKTLKDDELTLAYARPEDYSPLAKDNLKFLFTLMKKEMGIRAMQALRHIAELFDLFDIKPIDAIIEEFQDDEDFGYEDGLKLSAQRIGDVIRKNKLTPTDAK